MLQIVTELDGFDPRGNIKVLMATNRPDTLDPALLRPGRLDRKVCSLSVPPLCIIGVRFIVYTLEKVDQS